MIAAVEVLRRRPSALTSRRAGGRPPKPKTHRHSEVVHARLTPSEHLVLLRVLGARERAGFGGHASPTEWIREMLHEQATALGVEPPMEYRAVRHVRDVNAGRAAGAAAAPCAQCKRCL